MTKFLRDCERRPRRCPPGREKSLRLSAPAQTLPSLAGWYDVIRTTENQTAEAPRRLPARNGGPRRPENGEEGAPDAARYSGKRGKFVDLERIARKKLGGGDPARRGGHAWKGRCKKFRKRRTCRRERALSPGNRFRVSRQTADFFLRFSPFCI